MDLLKIGIAYIVLTIGFVLLFVGAVVIFFKIMKKIFKMDAKKWDRLFMKFNGKGLLLTVFLIYFLTVLIMIPINIAVFKYIDKDKYQLLSFIGIMIIAIYGSYKLPKSNLLIEKRMKVK